MFEVTRKAVLATSLALTFTAIEVHAQSAPPRDSPRLQPGMHVRVQSSGADTVITGKLSFIEDDSLVVAPDSTRGMFMRPFMVAIGRRDITKLEIERDEHTRDQYATALGVAGAVTGAVVAIKYCADNSEACNTVIQDPQYDDCNQDQSSWTAGELIVGAGALAGMLIGFIIAPPPHWDVIALPSRDAGRDGQMHYGIRVGFRYAFR